MCGHTHRSTDRALTASSAPRIFTAPAVATHPLPLRVYEVGGGSVQPVPHELVIVRRDAARLLFRALRDVSSAH